MAVLTALSGCAALAPAPQAVAPGVDVPAAWTQAADLAPASASNSAPAAQPGAAAVAPSTAHSASVAAAPQPTPLAQWWLRLGDPVLADLVTQALQANTDVRQAQAALRQARAQADVQGAALQPSLDASGSAQRRRASGSTGNSFQAGLDASWEPDLFGRLQSGVDASVADARAAAASLAGAQVSLAAEVALNYITLRSQQERLAIAQRNLTSQQETLQLTDWRVQAGLATSLVLEQARTHYEATVLTALQEVEDALVALRGDRERLLRLQEAAQAAGNAALLAQHRYRSGLIDFQSLLETQRTLLSTQDGVASTAASVAADHVRLYKALGGGWSPL